MAETSNLVKMHRAVAGDDRFAYRVEAACWTVDVPYTPQVLRKVAAAVVDQIDVDEFMTVSTDRVTDEEIIGAVQGIAAEAPAQ